MVVPSDVARTHGGLMKRLLLAFVLLWPASLLADFQAGMDAYNRNDYRTAYSEFLPLAEQGHRKARFYVGVMYLRGEGVPKDSERAYAWFDFAGVEESEKEGDPSVHSIKGTAPRQFGRSVLAIHLGSNEDLEGTFSLVDAIRAYGDDYLREVLEEERVQYTWSYFGTTLTQARLPPVPRVGQRTTSHVTTGACRLAIVTGYEDEILEVMAEGNACASVLDIPEVWRERQALYLTRPPSAATERARPTADQVTEGQ